MPSSPHEFFKVFLLSSEYRPSVDRPSTECWPITDRYIGEVSTNYRRSVGEVSVNEKLYRPRHIWNDYGPCLDRVSSDYRPSLDRLSTDYRPLYRVSTDRSHELLARPDKTCYTPSDAVFCFLVVPLFVFFFISFLFGLWFLTLFFHLACFPSWSCTWINIYFKLKCGVLFWKRDFKSSWSTYWPSLPPEKNHKLSRHIPPLKQQFFFQC